MVKLLQCVNSDDPTLQAVLIVNRLWTYWLQGSKNNVANWSNSKYLPFNLLDLILSQVSSPSSESWISGILEQSMLFSSRA